MSRQHSINHESEQSRVSGPSLSSSPRLCLGRLAPSHSPELEPRSFVTGGGDGYLSPRKGFAIVHHHSVTMGSQETTGFLGKREGVVAGGGLYLYLNEKIVSRRYPTQISACGTLLLLDLLRHGKAADDALDFGLERRGLGGRDACRDGHAAVGLLQHRVLQPQPCPSRRWRRSRSGRAAPARPARESASRSR